MTDWKFVDFKDVPSGPWARFGDNNTFVINQRKSSERLVKNAEGTELLRGSTRFASGRVELKLIRAACLTRFGPLGNS